MAFITTPLFLAPARSTTATSATTPRMQQAPISRRTALKIAAFSLVSTLSSAALAEKFDLKELKEDVEELKYDDEVTEIGPDPAEKNPLRIKKKQPEPAYRSEEKELRKEEGEKYDAMLAKEKEAEAKLKAQFSKGK